MSRPADHSPTVSLSTRLVATSVLFALVAACGTTSYPIRPYPSHKPFYELSEEDRMLYYCLNEMKGVHGNYELGINGKRFKTVDEMPLDVQPSAINNAFFYPIMIAGAIAVLGATGFVLYKVKFVDGDYYQNDGKRLIMPMTVLGAGAAGVLIGNAGMDKVANYVQYNTKMGTQFGIAPERQPRCSALTPELQKKLFSAYKDIMAPKGTPTAPGHDGAAAPAIPAPTAATPTGG